MKCNKMNLAALLVSTVFVGQAMAAQTTAASLVKTLDGRVAYCSARGLISPNDLNQKIVKIEKVQDSVQQKSAEVQLKVSVVKCADGQWQIDSNPQSERFTVRSLADRSEVTIEKAFSGYELLVVDANSEIVAAKHLADLEKVGTETVTIQLDKAAPNDQFEVILRVKSDMTASNGTTEEAHLSTFGSYNLKITE